MQALKVVEEKVCRGYVLDERKKWILLSEKISKEKEFLKHIESGEILLNGEWLSIAEVKKRRNETQTEDTSTAEKTSKEKKPGPDTADDISTTVNRGEENKSDQSQSDFPPETIFISSELEPSAPVTVSPEPEPDFPPETVYAETGTDYPPETSVLTMEEAEDSRKQSHTEESSPKQNDPLFKPSDAQIMLETISFDHSIIQAAQEAIKKKEEESKTVQTNKPDDLDSDWEISRTKRKKAVFWGTVITIVSAAAAAVVLINIL